MTGLIWNLVHGGGHGWRDDPRSRRAHDIATSGAALVFAARFVVSQWLYSADSTGGLAIARASMGLPLTALVAVVMLWAFRRTTLRLVTPAPIRRTRPTV
ncbi:DUF3159 domain-containing protein [Actinomycetospora endophytica]|uniref:DUF3159 domain-containing protein n=1 Tax=Actinomycetospora endophytica TaxID=2291215 RepID=A0ABS8P1Z6_9PSEU|nr:DUF3159 domain-containing protein [Actinomycetospora endophytica]